MARFSSQAGRWHLCKECGAQCPLKQKLCDECERKKDDAPKSHRAPRRVPAEAQTLDDDGSSKLESVTLKPNTVLGAYRVVELLGIGGIGQVYLADHVKLGRKVALKKLRREFTQNPVIVRRFFDEARAANQISHENIVEITDFIEDEENGSYLIMELLRGQDLGQLIESGAPLPIKRTISIMRQVADALAAAHQKGIVHRDLTPDNIFLTQRRGQADFVKILDFGIAKLSNDEDKGGRTTAAGSVLGTPAYMSPEQCLGRNVDYRTDIYAFGVMLYEMLSGLLPFEAETAGEFVVQHTTAIPRQLSDRMLDRSGLPLQLETLTMRCLEKEPDARPSSMDAIRSELEALADEHDISLQIYLPQSDPPPIRAVRTVAPEMDDTQPLPASEESSQSSKLIPLALVALICLAVGGWWATSRTEVVDTSPAADPPTPVVEAAEPADEVAPSVEREEQPEAEYVTIRFESLPPGAEVWRAGADVAIGTTPIEHSFLRAEGSTFEFRLRGHQPLRHEVRLDEDRTATVQLRPLERARMRVAVMRAMEAAMAPTMSRMDRNSTNGRRAVLEF